MSNSKQILRLLLPLICLLFTSQVRAQEISKEGVKAASRAEKLLKKGDRIKAEGEFRKAISKNPEQMDSRYNIGTEHYSQSQYKESLYRFAEAAELAKTEEEKHSAYHNLGNALMQNKDYHNAEQAFKEALKNDPFDEETRYNYALAKELAENEPPEMDDEQNEDDQNEDQDQDQDQNEDQDDDQDEGDDDKDQGQQDENEQDQEEDEQNQDQDDKPQQPQDGKMSPEQMQNLLDAIDNDEKEIQKRLEDEKEKGKDVKKRKYW